MWIYIQPCQPFQDIKRKYDGRKAQQKKIRQLGEAILNDPKATDTSYVNGVMNNVDQNWANFEDALNLRWVNPYKVFFF